MKKIFPLFLAVLSIAGCSQKINRPANADIPNKNKEIERIRFYARGCYGTCPHLIIEIDSFLNYKYYGELHAELQGYYVGRMRQSMWDSITSRLDEVNYKTLDSVYIPSQNGIAADAMTADGHSTEIIVWHSKAKKHVIAVTSSLPPNVADLWKWLIYSYRNVRLVPGEGGANFFKVQ